MTNAYRATDAVSFLSRLLTYLRETVRDSRDVEFRRPLRSPVKDPGDVLGIISVDRGVFASKGILFRPLENPDVLDAVLGQPRCVGDRAKREVYLKKE